MSTRDLIDAIASGDSVAIQKSFETEMAGRIAERLDTMRQDVAKNMFNEATKMKEEDDEMEDEDDEKEMKMEDFSLEELQNFMVSEEFEQLDEISKKTLSSYVKKASSDAADRAYFAGVGVPAPAKKQTKTKSAEISARFQKNIKKSDKRVAGIAKAVNRLAKEEVELVDKEMDQSKVHANALHVKPVGGGKYKVHAVGKNFEHGIKAGEHLSDTELDDFREMGGKIKHVK